jgi:hypothetical protein
MRYKTAVLATLAALPASAFAHPGPHTGTGPLEGMVHMLGQHYAPAVAGGLIVALLLLANLRGRRSIGRHQRIRRDRKECRK